MSSRSSSLKSQQAAQSEAAFGCAFLIGVDAAGRENALTEGIAFGSCVRKDLVAIGDDDDDDKQRWRPFREVVYRWWRNEQGQMAYQLSRKRELVKSEAVSL